jgi:hypothetical protein
MVVACPRIALPALLHGGLPGWRVSLLPPRALLTGAPRRPPPPPSVEAGVRRVARTAAPDSDPPLRDPSHRPWGETCIIPRTMELVSNEVAGACFGRGGRRQQAQAQCVRHPGLHHGALWGTSGLLHRPPAPLGGLPGPLL